MSLIQVIAKVDIANTVYTEASSAYISPTNDDDKKNHIHKKFFFPVFLRLFIFSVRPGIYMRVVILVFFYKHTKKHKLEKIAGTLAH